MSTNTSVTCPACGAVNPANYLFCAGCSKLLRLGGVSASEPAQSDTEAVINVAMPATVHDVAHSDAPTAEPTGAACGDCGAVNDAAYAFCAECGSAIAAKAAPIAAHREQPIYEADTADRVRLRFTLFASALLLALLGFVLALTIGVKWAATPAVLAVISIALGLGRMSGRSLALLRQDVASMLGDASADMASSSASATPMQAGLGAYTGQAADKVCGACGAVNPTNYRFCAECGSGLA